MLNDVRPWAIGLLGGVALACSPPPRPPVAPRSERTPAIATHDQLATLFDEILAKTRAREAWSPIKNERLGLVWEDAAMVVRPHVLEARTDRDLYYALVRLSNARKDRHLRVSPVEGGLEVPEVERSPRVAPVRFMTDYSVANDYSFFVADYARDLPSPWPGLGDRVVAIDGLPVARWVEQQEPWFRYSTEDHLWWRLSGAINLDRRGEGPPLLGDQLDVELQRADGERYGLSLPFRDEADVEWQGHAEPRYSGFEPLLSTESGTLFGPTDHREIVVVQWHRFGETLPADLEALMGQAAESGLLEHDLVVDVTRSRGGDGSAWAIQRFTGRRFEGTYGNIRISDILPDFIETVRRDDWEEPKEYGVLAWLEQDVTEAAARGDAYSAAVPFKLFHMPKHADGWFEPAAAHFRGRLACIFGPQGGSNLDQFGAMVVDNELGFTVGMPLGGYSNTWEWTETLHMPQTGRPLVDYMWSIGHTVRPNGEILEGNPARPERRLPLTAKNFRTYHDEAISLIAEHWRA